MASNKPLKAHPTDALLVQMGLLKDPVVEEVVKQGLAAGDDDLWRNEELIEEVMNQEALDQDDLDDELHWGLGVLMHHNALERQQSAITYLAAKLQELKRSKSGSCTIEPQRYPAASDYGGRSVEARYIPVLQGKPKEPPSEVPASETALQGDILTVTVQDGDHFGVALVLAMEKDNILAQRLVPLQYQGQGKDWKASVSLLDLFPGAILTNSVKYDPFPACEESLNLFLTEEEEIKTLLRSRLPLPTRERIEKLHVRLLQRKENHHEF